MGRYPDIERHLEEKLIKGLRRVFEFDSEFRYNDNDNETGIMITPDFPEKDCPFKVPHIVVTEIGFQNDVGITLNNNFEKDVARYGILNYASSSFAQIPYTLSLICLGQEDISRNLGNKLFYYLNFRAFRYLSDYLQLNIQRVSKAPSSPKEQYPEKIFQTPVAMQGSLTLQITETPFDYISGNVSRPVVSADQLGKSFSKINVSVDNEQN